MAFRKLALIPVLAPNIRAGRVEDLLYLKSEGEAIRYSTYIYDSWLSLLDYNLDYLRKVDYYTIK